MKARSLSRIAAALLLAPLGLAGAQSAAAQSAFVFVQGTPAVVAVQEAVIERFVVRAHGPVRPGSEVRYRLVGTPGARVVLNIPGIARGLHMAETRPGVYQAGYVVRHGDNLRALANARAALHLGGQRVVARADVRFDRDDRWARRDQRAPEIFGLTPSHGEQVDERGRTRISARIQDEGSGIDPHSVVLRVDGQDVSRYARIFEDEVRYRDDLAPGRHVAELAVRDRAGNVSRRAWSFVVADEDRYSYYDGRY